VRLTNADQVDLPEGRLRSLELPLHRAPGELPVSFDQGMHLRAGARPGSWMAAALRVPGGVRPDELAASWRAVVERHGTLRSAFAETDEGLRLHPLELALADEPARWVEHPTDPELPAPTRTALRTLFDAACSPLESPSHRLALLEPTHGNDPVVVIAADHAHVDAWSLPLLVRDLLSCLDDHRAGRVPASRLPRVGSFAEHTAELAAQPPAPEHVLRRWHEILGAGGGAMPTFPLPLGDVSAPRPEVVSTHDLLDPRGLARLEARASLEGVGPLAMAVSVMTRASASLAGAPLRAVLPVHSRHQSRWRQSVGWFITNAVLESADPTPQACGAAVREAVGLGSHALAPIMAPYDGMPVTPGMFAVSWLDHRRLPVALDPAWRAQHVSAVAPTQGVQVWFVADGSGLHVRLRSPATPQAQASVGAWVDAVVEGLRSLV